MMKDAAIAVIGAGYVGLVQALGLASLGHDIVCIDTDARKIEALRASKAPIYEDGLEDLLASATRAGNVRFSTDVADAGACTIFFIAVGTPTSAATGNARLDYLHKALHSVAATAPNGASIAVKSTVPIGTCARLQKMLDEHYPDKALAVVSNPEFLREGSAIQDFLHPERIVIGSANAQAVERVAAVYAKLAGNDVPVLRCDTTTAETIKYAANAFLATKVTFINEIADLIEVVGGDVDMVARGIGLDKRIGPQFLQAGPGYGGSCFPKDTLALATIGRRHGVQQRIVETVIRINESRRFHILQRIEQSLADEVAGKTIAVLGLAFKANTDDTRDSPAVDIIHALLEEGVNVRAFDPVARYDAGHPGYGQFDTIEGACTGADAILCATEWPQFARFDFSRVNDLVQRRYIFDMRRVIDTSAPGLEGWRIDKIGRKQSSADPSHAEDRA